MNLSINKQVHMIVIMKLTSHNTGEEATKRKGATLLNWSDFLLQNISHIPMYGEALNE